MSSSLSASQLHTVNMKEPLNRVLGKNPSAPRPRSLLMTDTRPKALSASGTPFALDVFLYFKVNIDVSSYYTQSITGTQCVTFVSTNIHA